MKKFVNCSNHPSRLWSVMQRETAEKYGEIVDVPFPAVACDLTDSGLEELAEQIKGEKPEVTTEEIRELQTTYEDMLKAILWVLDGAKYLWQGSTNREEKSPDSGNC